VSFLRLQRCRPAILTATVYRLTTVSLLMTVCLLVGLAAPDARSIAAAGTGNGEVVTLEQRCQRLTWCTPSFWAWELRLATHQNEPTSARNLATKLVRLQQADGKWGLGTDWGRTSYDFKHRTSQDAESWEVAEVALALLAHAETTPFPRAAEKARASALLAAKYLKRHVVRLNGRPYLGHMPECNYRLQPHSTIAAAALLATYPRFQQLADQLRSSGKRMKSLRIVPAEGQRSLKNWRWGPPINDYERVQVGWYLDMMGDPAGQRTLRRYERAVTWDFYRGPAYLAMVAALAGRPRVAQRLARADNFSPLRGYDVALADWSDYLLATR